MRSFGRVRVAAGGLVALAAGFGSLAACGGDDNVIPDGGDASGDVALPDHYTVDAGMDGMTSGDVYDATALLAFPALQVTAFCTRVQSCCYGSATGSLPTCENLASAGIEGNLADLYAVLDGGNLRLDPTAAASCLAGLGTMTCGVANDVDGGGTNITAAEYNTIVQECYSAVYGVVAQGGVCKADSECASGLYCAAGVGADGGPTRTCVPLLGNGQGPCTVNTNYECESRGYLGSPGATCEGDGGASGSCAPRLPNGANCTYSFECASGLCNQYLNPSCAAVGPIVDFPITCDVFFGVDGG